MNRWVLAGGLRWWILLVYCILLAAGTSLVVHRTPENLPGLVASRELEANRLLQPGDISPVSTTPQYLTRSVKADEALKPGDISAFPSLSLKENEWPFAIPVGHHLVTRGTVNAGANVRICKAGKVVFEPASVRTVLCPPVDRECIAVVVLTSPKSDDVAGAFGTGDRPYLRAIPSAPPDSPSAEPDPFCK